MNFEVIKEPFPCVKLDNYFSVEEETDIINEITTYKMLGLFLDPKSIGAAVDTHGKSMRSGTGVFVDNVFRNRDNSPILRYTRKVFHPDIKDAIIEATGNKDILGCNSDHVLLNYYGDQDEYDLHYDKGMYTCVIFIVTGAFSGGLLEFEDGTTIKPIHNQGIIFPSYLKHRVTKVHGEGRYSLAHFFKKV
jgi:hypothetical protein